MKTLHDAWDVFALFIIPVGGGIPGGVLLAKARGYGLIFTSVLYFISDVCLALVFEPFMLLAIHVGKRVEWVAKVTKLLKASTAKTIAHYGNSLGPLALVLLAFGVDPMTGRAAAKASGHGFFAGWTISIAGDMIYFALIMVSTLFLNSVLGDGTQATLIILAIMMFGPVVVRKWKARKAKAVAEDF